MLLSHLSGESSYDVLLTLFAIYIYLQHLATRSLIRVNKPLGKPAQLMELAITLIFIALLTVIWL